MSKADRKKTIGQAMQEVHELDERASVHMALASFLHTRYLPRDSMEAQAQIQCSSGAVSEAMIEEVAQELEEGADEMKKAMKAYQSEVISG